ncbi:MAG: hypothetical protein M1838_005798 [Thelocarpon superellum]|nr:MAG: hypothetical protein M1838_005798 [Thelocarpon superellum]
MLPFPLPDGLPQFQIQTRQALLVLDLQNDFVSMHSQLSVSLPYGFLDRIHDLIPAFRDAGEIIWVRSEFEAVRTVNDPRGEGESVITDQQLPEEQRGRSTAAPEPMTGFSTGFDEDSFQDLPEGIKPSPRAMNLFRRAAARYGSPLDPDHTAPAEPAPKAAPDPDWETFLSLSPDGREPTCCKPNTFGAQFVDLGSPMIDESRDTILTKTHYSAFSNPELLSFLRENLVTDLFVCGVTSNISVYATALDAARHGLSITLLDDCVGYRDRARHDEAMKQMTEYMGADVMPSTELIQLLNGSAEDASEAAEDGSSVGNAVGRATLERIVDGSALKASPLGATSTDSAASRPSTLPPKGEISKALEQARRLAAEAKDARPKQPLALDGASDGRPHARAEVEKESINKEIEHIRSRMERQLGLEESKRDHNPKQMSVSNNPTQDQRASQRAYVNRPTTRVRRSTRSPAQATPPGPDGTFGQGDARLVKDLLPATMVDEIFDRIQTEVHWETMYHRGGEVPRLVAVQGVIDSDGSRPIYRHPADESPPLSAFTVSVLAIRKRVQEVTQEPFNHVLIQRYRDGQDHISEHSDKTLDIVKGSSIVNVSLGALRTMVLRTKKSMSPPKEDLTDAPSRQVQRIELLHNSLFVLGPETNRRWLHGIKPDKRTIPTKSDAERAFGGERISLTFRHIGTFTDAKSRLIWGQGAMAKKKTQACRVVNGDTPEAENLIVAFGRENHSYDLDWDDLYGKGSNVLHIATLRPKLYLSGDEIIDIRVMLVLAEALEEWELGSPVPSRPSDRGSASTSAAIRFVDIDAEQSEIEGDTPILFYVETYYRQDGRFGSIHSRREIATVLTRVAHAREAHAAWLEYGKDGDQEVFLREMSRWEDFASRSRFIAGETFSVADCSFWPVLSYIIESWPGWSRETYPKLHVYHQRVMSRPTVQSVLQHHEALSATVPSSTSSQV